MNRVRRFYRAAVPEPLRRLIRKPFSGRLYDRAFFHWIDDLQSGSYDTMAATIIERLAPRSVIDVGCGSGGLLEALARRGVPRLVGLEASPVTASKRGLEVRKVDLTTRFSLPPDFDVAVCLEVAEHLPASSADQLVDSLTSGPRTLVFSAATPGQGGHGHINEQPHEYWIDRFAARGFEVDDATTAAVREEWSRAGVASWYCRNVFFLRR